MSATLQRSRIAPWVGLVVPPLAWVAHHQIGSDLIFYDCRVGQTPLIVGMGVSLALVTVAAGIVSWFSRSRGEIGVRGFVAVLGALTAAVFLLGLLYQTEAALILPACHR